LLAGGRGGVGRCSEFGDIELEGQTLEAFPRADAFELGARDGVPDLREDPAFPDFGSLLRGLGRGRVRGTFELDQAQVSLDGIPEVLLRLHRLLLEREVGQEPEDNRETETGDRRNREWQ